MTYCGTLKSQSESLHLKVKRKMAKLSFNVDCKVGILRFAIAIKNYTLYKVKSNEVIEIMIKIYVERHTGSLETHIRKVWLLKQQNYL